MKSDTASGHPDVCFQQDMPSRLRGLEHVLSAMTRSKSVNLVPSATGTRHTSPNQPWYLMRAAPQRIGPSRRPHTYLLTERPQTGSEPAHTQPFLYDFSLLPPIITSSNSSPS